ncbi:MAG TPA: tetratricopeptide repeat protein [Bacteroidia bacterium]
MFLLPFTSLAQQEKKFIFEGNKEYKNKKFEAAEKNYKAGISKNKNSYKGAFNLGDALYKQEKYEEAAEQFQALTHKATSKDTLAKAYHNLGNSFLKSKKYKESVEAYKNALKNNPKDEDTRYNLACAQQYLKQQQQQQQKDKDKDQDKKDDKKDKDKKDQEKKEQEKKDQEKKAQDKKDKKDQQKPEEQKNKISKEDAQRLLDALQNDEKNLQEKAKKGQPGMKVKIEKDW